jgi:toluene monooxygenase system protein E
VKTYWHLAERRRIPSEYEIATARLFWHVERGFEVEVPVADWYRRHQRDSALAARDWDEFTDPSETTYARYIARQAGREAHVEGVLRYADDTDYDRGLPAERLAALGQVVAPQRYLAHGLQMVAAYVGQMAPSGRLTILCAFQAADEVRRIQRLAYRMAQIRRVHPAFGDDARERWQADPAWQPTRRLVERLLVTWDWGEAFVGLNLCAKVVLDEVLLQVVPRAAGAAGDPLFAELAFSLWEDSDWHRRWSGSLVGFAKGARAENGAPLRQWVARWLPEAEAAGSALAAAFGVPAEPAAPRARAWLGELGLLS